MRSGIRALVQRGVGLVVCGGSLLVATTAATAAAEEFVPVPERAEVRFEVTPEQQAQVPERFRLGRHTFPAAAKLASDGEAVRMWRITFPSPVESDEPLNNTVHGEYYQPAGEGPFPGVVVLHILGGGFPLSQMTAQALADRGVAALFIKMPYYGERRTAGSPRRMISEDPEETVRGMTQAVLDIRRAAAWLADRPEVDRERLGLTGISLGGITTALAGACEPMFERVAIYLGGGDFARVIWESPRKDAEQFRKEWTAAGGTRESWYEALRPVDPCTYAHLLQDRKVLMVAARHDEIVVPDSTLALYEALGRRPTLIWLDAGHITAGKYILLELKRMGDFFTQGFPAAAETGMTE